MNLWHVSNPLCGCDADVTAETAAIEAVRGRPPQRKRAKQVHHARARDGARFWHWSDVRVVRI